VVSRTGRSATLGCVISVAERIRADIAWYKDYKRILDDGGLHYTITRNETKSLLTITKVCECETVSRNCFMKQPYVVSDSPSGLANSN